MFMLETKRSSNFEAYLKFLIMRGYLEVQNWTIYECSCSFGISRRKREIVNCDYSAPSSSVYLCGLFVMESMLNSIHGSKLFDE